jgi:hypothetical protein
MRMCRWFVALLCTAWAHAARSEDLYQFVVSCKSDSLKNCFNRVETALDQVRQEQQGNALCLPPNWYPVPMPSSSYPVSLLDYLLMRLSAARVSRPSHPYRVVMRDVLTEMYPCRPAKH